MSRLLDHDVLEDSRFDCMAEFARVFPKAAYVKKFYVPRL